MNTTKTATLTPTSKKLQIRKDTVRDLGANGDTSNNLSATCTTTTHCTDPNYTCGCTPASGSPCC